MISALALAFSIAATRAVFFILSLSFTVKLIELIFVAPFFTPTSMIVPTLLRSEDVIERVLLTVYAIIS